MTDLSKLTKAQLVALLSQGAAPEAPPVPSPVVASLAIPDSAWEALESALAGAYDSHSRDTTFLGAVLNFGKLMPADWRGKQLPEDVASRHADNVKRKLYASYGTPEQIAAMPKDAQDRIAKSCNQKHSRAKALFTCAAILPVAYEQGFKGGVVEAGKLCTALKDSNYSLAAVMAARAAAASAKPDLSAEWGALIDRCLNMKGEGDNIPKCLQARAKAVLVKLAVDCQVTLKHAHTYRNDGLI